MEIRKYTKEVTRFVYFAMLNIYDLNNIINFFNQKLNQPNIME